MPKTTKSKTPEIKFVKTPTGIRGFDEIAAGGLPQNRSTLLVGATGCGKTVMAMEFLVNGAILFEEAGVFITFEEKKEELMINVESFGFALDELIKKNKLYIEYIPMNEKKITGNYSIEGLFVRIEQAINKVKAKRVVLDSLDTLFTSLDYDILRSEFSRLILWLKEKKVTVIITAEKGDTFLTRNGLEEYVADCVVELTNRIKNQIATRILRIVKFRGSMHGTSEYPFIIDEKGVSVFPIIREAIQQKASTKRISTGIKQLDEMLDNKGFFLGSSILVSGSAGTGKTSLAASFAYSVCKGNERCFYCAFEEDPSQITRNMQSIGLNLGQMVKAGLLHFYYSRPSLQNLELHFIAIKRMIKEIKPAIVILDPITNLMTEGPNSDIRSMLIRFVDYLKAERVTGMFTAAITMGSIERNPSDEGISSMVDTWLMVKDVESDGKRSRNLGVMKSRGMAHSKEVREFKISYKGVSLSEIIVSRESEHTYSKNKYSDQENPLVSGNKLRAKENGHNGHVKTQKIN
jgi:circadian clock protein KaiC